MSPLDPDFADFLIETGNFDASDADGNDANFALASPTLQYAPTTASFRTTQKWTLTFT